MKPKTVMELLSDAEAVYSTLGISKKSASQRIKKATSDMYSREYRENENRAAMNSYSDEKSAAIRRLSKIQSMVKDAAESETPTLHASSLNPNLMALLRIKGLTAKDFKDLARRNINNHTALRAIEGEAQERGFVLEAYHSAEKIGEAAEAYIGRLIQSIKDDDTHMETELPPIDGVFLDPSRQYANKMLEPFSLDDVRCYKNDIESAISDEIITERQKAVTPETDAQFEQGFRGQKSTPVDYSSFPALSAVSDKLSEVNMPEKSKRVLDALFSVTDSARLHEGKALSAEEIKLASDRTQDVALAAELREIGDLFLPDGQRFSPAPGTATVAVNDLYNEKARWKILAREAAALQDRETVAKNAVTIANASNKNNASRQERREAAERQRYESVKTVDRTDANDTP